MLFILTLKYVGVNTVYLLLTYPRISVDLEKVNNENAPGLKLSLILFFQSRYHYTFIHFGYYLKIAIIKSKIVFPSVCLTSQY